MESSTLTRRVGTRQVRKTVVVVCEGEKTEPRYVEALARQSDVREAAAVDLRIEGARQGEVPLTLVRRAIDVQSRAKKQHGEVDEIWCLFDVEWPRNHPNLDGAIALAGRHGIRLAVSNPCFEIWLILHREFWTRWLDNGEARRIRRRCDGERGKDLQPKDYMSARRVAADRAAELDRRHEGNGTAFPHNNPSSAMHRLLRAVSQPI